MALKVCFLGAVRRRTFICCRNIQISTSSAVRDRNRSATIQTMSLTRSLIPQEHRPILDQLPVRLSLRQGHPDTPQRVLGIKLRGAPPPDRESPASQSDAAIVAPFRGSTPPL